MKKTLKKSLALLLCVSLLLSCMVIFVPVQSSATGAGKYTWELKVNSGNNTGGWDKADWNVYGKSKNGTGSETNIGSASQNVDFDNWKTIATGTTSEFPTKVTFDYKFGGGATWREMKGTMYLYVNGTEAGSADIGAKSSLFSAAEGTKTLTVENGKYPVPTTVTSSYAESSLTCPADSSSNVTNSLTYSANDQYGTAIDADFCNVTVNGSSSGTTGISTSNTHSGSDTTTVAHSANIAGTTNSQTVTATSRWTLNGSTSASTARFTLNDATYTATYNYTTTNASDPDSPNTDNSVTATAQYGCKANVPSSVVYSYYDTTNHYSGSYNNTALTKNATFNMNYTATAHSYTGTVNTPATCTAPGETTYTCSCGYSYVDSSTPAAIGHAWDNGVVTKDPTCTESGVKLFTCLNDSTHTKTESVDPLGHDYVGTVTAPTCEEQGYTTYICSRCRDSYISDYTEPTGHSWDDGVITTQPTATTPGIRTFTCRNNASHKKTEEFYAESTAHFEISKVNGVDYDGTYSVNSGDNISIDLIINRKADDAVKAWAIGYAFNSDVLILNNVTFGTNWPLGTNSDKTTYYSIGSVSTTTVKAESEVMATLNFTVDSGFTGETVITMGYGQNFIGVVPEGSSSLTAKTVTVTDFSFNVEKGTDKTALWAAMDAAADYFEPNYTVSSWAILTEALTNARSVYDNGFATQAQVDEATETLTQAMNSLVPAANKSALRTLVNKAVIELSKTDLYTAGSLSALQTAVDNANVILADGDATQTTVDAHYNIVNYNLSQLKYNSFTIKFVDEDGTEISSANYNYGDTVTPPAAPSKPADNTYTYEFAGWTPEITAATSNATYTATYTKTYIDYTVKFVDEDGTEISSATYHYDDTVTVPDAPSKAADNVYTYEFAGWTPEVSTVTADQTYTATYSASYIDYEVKFVNYDGSEISSATYHYGDTVIAPEEIPVKPGDDVYTYVFSGWSPELKAVDGDITYTAQFTADKNLYTVKFVNYDGSIISEAQYAIGDEVVVPTETPVRESDGTYYYTFKGWAPEVSEVTGTATYTATYDAHYLDADYTAVDAAVAAAQAIQADNYTAVSYARVTAALEGVTRGLTVDRQAEVDAMAKAINDALAALVTTGAYEAAWEKCAAVNNDNNQFTVDSYNAFTLAMTNIGAKKDFNNETATQADVDAAAKELNDAYNLLVATTLEIGGADDTVLDGSALVIKANNSIENSQLIANDGGAGISELRYLDANGNEVSSHVLATGYKVQLIQGGEVKVEKDIVVYGDINGDGQVSIADIALARKLASSTDGYDSLQVAAAQCGSGSVDVQNVIDIAKA